MRPSLEGIKVILLDIEGTICPITFVKDVLFPYALETLPEVLQTHWTNPSFQPYIEAFPSEHRSSPTVLEAYVRDLTRRDVKVACLKNLQEVQLGYLWESGYKSGAYSTPLFPDVVPHLKQWHDGSSSTSSSSFEGKKKIAVYSSGSVFAQKLLFAHVNVADPSTSTTTSTTTSSNTTNGRINTVDMTPLVSHWFDTVNAGPKTDADSYRHIVQILSSKSDDNNSNSNAGVIDSAGEVLFLSDHVLEIDAAVEAGMKAVVVVRPGNKPLPLSLSLPSSLRSRQSVPVVEQVEQTGFGQGDNDDDNEKEKQNVRYEVITSFDQL